LLYHGRMSVEQIKSSLNSLTEQELKEVSIYIRQLRNATDVEYREMLAARLDDKDPSHWVSLDDLKRRFPGEWPNG
jgi:hypothetical protein